MLLCSIYLEMLTFIQLHNDSNQVFSFICLEISFGSTLPQEVKFIRSLVFQKVTKHQIQKSQLMFESQHTLIDIFHVDLFKERSLNSKTFNHSIVFPKT